MPITPPAIAAPMYPQNRFDRGLNSNPSGSVSSSSCLRWRRENPLVELYCDLNVIPCKKCPVPPGPMMCCIASDLRLDDMAGILSLMLRNLLYSSDRSCSILMLDFAPGPCV